MTTSSNSTQDDAILPWVANEVGTSGIWLHVQGFNHWTDREFSWSLSTWSFENTAFVAERYDFRCATITDAGRERLRDLVSWWTDEERAAVAGLVDLLAGAKDGAA